MFDYNASTAQLRNGVDPDTGIDFDAHYQIGRPGVAWYLVGYDLEWTNPDPELICDGGEGCNGPNLYESDRTPDGHDPGLCYIYPEGELIENKNTIRAIMVGDDRVDVFGIDELTLIKREDFCGECGQMGCTHDGLDRDEEDENGQWPPEANSTYNLDNALYS